MTCRARICFLTTQSNSRRGWTSPSQQAAKTAAATSQRDAMRYEAQSAFLALDDLNRAVK